MSQDELASMVKEEIFCDMFGGIDSYGTHASRYTALARWFVQQKGIARTALTKITGRTVTDAEALAYLSLEERRRGPGKSAAQSPGGRPRSSLAQGGQNRAVKPYLDAYNNYLSSLRSENRKPPAYKRLTSSQKAQVTEAVVAALDQTNAGEIFDLYWDYEGQDGVAEKLYSDYAEGPGVFGKWEGKLGDARALAAQFDQIAASGPAQRLSLEEKSNDRKQGVISAGNSLFNVKKVAGLLKTEPDTAFFWSGKTEGIGGKEVAAQIATEKGGVTLETIIESKGIEMPKWDFNIPESIDAWSQASLLYAQQVSGEVRAVIGSNLRAGNIWETVELPRLMANPNVTKITTIDPKNGTEKVIFERTN